MLAAERRDLLMTRLRRDGKLVARDLAREFGLSEDSVRRDLRELAAAGLCQRVYGGAVPLSPALSTHASRAGIAPESKQRVAARAVELIAPGSVVILDSGTTGLAIARALPPDLAATIVTHSPATAAALAEHPNVEVFVLEVGSTSAARPPAAPRRPRRPMASRPTCACSSRPEFTRRKGSPPAITRRRP